MKKALLKICIIIICTVVYSSITLLRPNSTFTSTVFNISGIMFSIGLGLIVTFNLTGVKNKNYIKKIRQNIKHISQLFIIHFSLASICFLLNSIDNSSKNIVIYSHLHVRFNLSVAYNIVIIYSIIYFIINFLAIQTLKDDIFDKTNEE